MVKTIEMFIYVTFALAGAGLLIYFVINALPDMKPEPVVIKDDVRGLFGTCDNTTAVCVLDEDGVTEVNKMRCEVQLAEILCHSTCPC